MHERSLGRSQENVSEYEHGNANAQNMHCDLLSLSPQGNDRQTYDSSHDIKTTQKKTAVEKGESWSRGEPRHHTRSGADDVDTSRLRPCLEPSRGESRLRPCSSRTFLRRIRASPSRARRCPSRSRTFVPKIGRCVWLPFPARAQSTRRARGQAWRSR